MPYVERLAEPLLAEYFAQLPALMLTGPRASGKTTTAKRHAKTIVHLDDPLVAPAYAASPDAIIKTLQEPILLDEWQAVPEVLGAVKRAVDADPRPGRFILTGSVRADLESATWPGTGRIIRIPIYGLTEREIQRKCATTGFLDKALSGSFEAFALPSAIPDLPGYLDLALRGTFPEPALNLTGRARSAWLSGYIDQLLTRDAQHLRDVRDPTKLRRYFEATAIKTADRPGEQTLREAAGGIAFETARAFDNLLCNLFILELVPAWVSNRLKQLTTTHKRYLVDAALAASVLRLTKAGLIQDADMFGRIMDTFVLSQIAPEVALHALEPRIFHLRDNHQHEVDILIELPQGVIGIEVKAGEKIDRHEARHLEWLRAHLGDRFLAGILLHSGPHGFQLGERVFALPICALWG
ncbi:MAG: ATP-binding protein [Chloroflexota bacterium]